MNVTPLRQKHFSGLQFDESAQKYLSILEGNFEHDFSTSGRGYFTFENESKIAEQAFTMAKEKLSTAKSPITEADLKGCWNEVVTDFHRNSFWGFLPQGKKPTAELTEDQKTRREMWPYIWVLIQSGIILKTIVYYFGLRTSEDPTTENKIYLILALCTSAGTLIFFAWRKSRK